MGSEERSVPADADDLDPLAAFEPKASEPKLVIEVSPPREDRWALVRRSAIGLAIGAVIVWLSPVVGLLAFVLPAVFLAIAYRVLTLPQIPHTLRFDDEHVEVSSARGWTRVTWDRVTSLAKTADAQARLETERGTIAQLDADALRRVLEARVLPAHVEVREPPPPEPARKAQPMKTVVLWVILIGLLWLVSVLLGEGSP